MSDVDAIELGGWLLSMWASGFVVGLLASTFRKLMEKI